MGSYLEMCPCSREDETKGIGGEGVMSSQRSRINQEDYNNTLSENDQLLNYKSRLPSNVINFKIRTQNLIVKRFANPNDQYEIESQLGSGSFGTVYKVIHKVSLIPRAMKMISKEFILQGLNSDEITNEINILRLLDHPNIMKIFEFYEDLDNFYIVSEFCDQGDLCEKLKKIGTLTEFTVKFFMSQVFNAIAYLHSKHIIHGDIKLENLLLYSTSSSNKMKKRFSTLGFQSKESELENELNNIRTSLSQKTKDYLKDITNYEIKLIDFGCSKMFNRKKLSGIIGTTVYCSPEVIDDNYREECDEWACGILMYILLSGEPPFNGEDEDDIFANIKKGSFTFNKPSFKKISTNCKDLIKKLLDPNPKTRMRAIDALKHPFFTKNINVDELLTDKTDMSLLGELMHTKTGESKFQQSVMAYIALNFVDKEEEKKIRNVFRVMNKDNSAYTITKDEFKKHLLKEQQDIGEDRIEEIFKAIDSDQNGSIEYQELIRALSDKKQLLQEKNLKAAFDFFDVDNSGSITWEEINNIIFSGQKVNNNLITEFLSQINKAQSEQITFEEFCEIMLS